MSAQSCEFFTATCPRPSSLSICDLGFSSPLTIEHFYPTDHDFTVEITYEPAGLNLTNPDILDGFEITTDGIGNTVVTGTFTVPFNPPAEDNPSSDVITFLFDRISTWDGLDQLLVIRVFDADCG